MDPPRTTRPPPRIIRVPPPEGLTVAPTLIVTATLGLLVVGVIALCLGLMLVTGVAVVGVVALAGAGWLTWWWPRHRRRRERQRLAYVAKLRERGEDPLVPEIAECWQSSKGVSDDDVKTVLIASTMSDPPRAAVVCLGKIDVPEVGEIFFEPEIITPTGYMGRRLIFIPIAAALIFVWVLQKIGILPFRIVHLGRVSYLLWMGVAIAGAWVWRSAVRPTYIRMAPGVIQIMQYRYRRAKPLIRSYPMDGETLAILRGKATGKKGPNLKLTLLRAERKDTVDLSRMRKREEVAERMWQALLSTAPTPPLNDEELVG
jgi:hypothetical protein